LELLEVASTKLRNSVEENSGHLAGKFYYKVFFKDYNYLNFSIAFLQSKNAGMALK